MSSTTLQLRKYHELDGKIFLVGVGAMKCATGWVYSYLRSLPEVTVSPLKELHFFNSKLSAQSGEERDLFALKRLAFHIMRDGDVVDNLRSRQAFQASLDRVKMVYDDNAYFAHFARICAPESNTVCDITPAYSVIGRCGFEYMRDFFASQDVSLRIFFVMRDPVDRLWSQLRYLQQNDPSQNALKSWREAICNSAVLERGDYRQVIEGLEAVFPRQDILFLFYEDLFSQASLKRLCAFAEAGHLPPNTDEIVNETSLKIDLPDAVRDELQEVLAPQYAFCRQYFGDLVPNSWRA